MEPRSRVRSLAGKLGLLCASALVTLGLLEFVARLAALNQRAVTLGEQEVYTVTDPVLGWRNKPGALVTYNRREFKTSVTINSLGFRDVERKLAKTPGRGRVLAIGDSFVEGFTVELDESMTRKAEAMATGQGCPIEVINAGVHAYSTDQEALWFTQSGRAMEPDVVVVFVYYNDILNNTRVNYWGSPKPVVEVVDGQIVAGNLPLPYVAASTSPGGVRVKPAPPRQGSALKEMITGRLFMGAPALYQRLATFGFWPAPTAEPIPDELRAYKDRSLEDFTQAWGKTSQILEALGASIRSTQAEPVLVHIPARFEISDRDWALTAIRYGIDTRKNWDRTLVRRRLSEIASKGGWSFLDLTPALAASTTFLNGEPYFAFDGHWNARGHAVVAQTLIEFLKQRSLLPCEGAPAKGASPARE